MSDGPIKREREATTAPRVPRAPKLGDIVILDPAPFGYERWRVVDVPSSALGPEDVVTLGAVDPDSPLQRTRRRVHQIRLPEVEESKK